MSKKVLFVCKAGARRSKTAAEIFSQPPYNFQTKFAGAGDFSKVKVTQELLDWADEIVTMDDWQREQIATWTRTDIYCFRISDKYNFMDSTLIEILKHKYEFREELE